MAKRRKGTQVSKLLGLMRRTLNKSGKRRKPRRGGRKKRRRSYL